MLYPLHVRFFLTCKDSPKRQPHSNTEHQRASNAVHKSYIVTFLQKNAQGIAATGIDNHTDKLQR